MGRDLTNINNNGNGSGLSMRDQFQWAKLAAEGDIVPEAYRGNPSNILVAIGFGASMGLSPAESLYRISVIKGKPTMSAELVASQVRRAGHKLRITKDSQRMSVTATIVRADDPDYPTSVVRDMEWAKRMGLANNPNYTKQPLTMLTWRAITACAREACPEALYGAGYTPDELDDQKPVEQPVDVKVVPTPAQREELHDLIRKAGAKTKPEARRVIQSLTPSHVDTDDVTKIPDDDVLLLLDNKQTLASKIAYILELDKRQTATEEASDGR